MTPHINAKKGDIAKIVLLPGDPLRAKFIAEKYLSNVKLVSSIRNMLFFTGTYKGKTITVGGSGMGHASIGIYSYELFKFYDVDKIIRIGSTGSYIKELNLYDIVLVKSSITDSTTFSKLLLQKESRMSYPDESLNNQLRLSAKKHDILLHECLVHSSNVFYSPLTLNERLKYSNNASCVEMETTALFVNAEATGKKAACLLTVSDNLTNDLKTTAFQRERTFEEMVQIALEVE